MIGPPGLGGSELRALVDGPSHRTGLILALTAVLVISPDTLIIRLVNESPWTILFWRGLLTALSLTIAITIATKGQAPRAFQAIGRIGLVVAVFQACGSILFVTAVTRTSAANALVIIATGPLFAAVLSRIFLAERIPHRTWIAAGCVSGAVGLLFSGSLQTNQLLGDLAALGGSVSIAATGIAIRHAKAVNMVPAMAVGSLLFCLIAATLGARFPQVSEFGLLILQGSVIIPTAVGLAALALRFLSAPEGSLVARLEMILGPLWVWWFLGEAPSIRAAVSGVVIAGALAIHTAMGQGRDDGGTLPTLPAQR